MQSQDLRHSNPEEEQYAIKSSVDCNLHRHVNLNPEKGNNVSFDVSTLRSMVKRIHRKLEWSPSESG
jgi:hypothetical protein